jgi:hypothetical protein
MAASPRSDEPRLASKLGDELRSSASAEDVAAAAYKPPRTTGHDAPLGVAPTGPAAFIWEGVVELPPLGSVRPAPDATSNIGAYYNAPPIFRDDLQGAFYVAQTHGNKDKLAENNTTGIPATAVHEALPGHDIQFRMFQKFRDQFPRFRWLGASSMNMEGWAMYATELMRKRGYFTKAEEYMDAVVQAGATRYAMADLAIHMGKTKLEDAVKDWMKLTGQAKDAVLQLFYRYYAMPLQSINYIVGQMELEDLRRDSEKRWGAGEAEFTKVPLPGGPCRTSHPPDHAPTPAAGRRRGGKKELRPARARRFPHRRAPRR